MGSACSIFIILILFVFAICVTGYYFQYIYFVGCLCDLTDEKYAKLLEPSR